jgi:vacuolar-type H+-ATPase subunit C/Vma6
LVKRATERRAAKTTHDAALNEPSERRTKLTDTGRELFEHELRDIYDAENKLVNALQKMTKNASDGQEQMSEILGKRLS